MLRHEEHELNELSYLSMIIGLGALPDRVI